MRTFKYRVNGESRFTLRVPMQMVEEDVQFRQERAIKQFGLSGGSFEEVVK